MKHTSQRTQTSRQDEARDRLLSATEALIGEVGTSGFTLADVGARAGLSRGLASHYFPNKDALVYAAAERLLAVDPDEVEPDLGLSVLMRNVTASFSAASTQPKTRARLVILGQAHASSPYRSLASRYLAGRIEMVAAHLRCGVSSGEIRADLDVSAQAALIVYATLGASHVRAAGSGDLRPAGVAREYARTLRISLERPA